MLFDLDLSAYAATEKMKRNYRATDWEAFKEVLGRRLEGIEQPREFGLGEALQADTARRELERVVMETIEEHVPLCKEIPFKRRWWTKDLDKKRKLMHQASRSYHAAVEEDERAWKFEEYRRIRNDYTDEVKKTKEEHWEEWLEGIDGEEKWKASQLVGRGSSDGGRTKIPTLKVRGEGNREGKAETSEEKSKAFFEAYFPKRSAPPVANNPRRVMAKWEYLPTSDQQIH